MKRKTKEEKIKEGDRVLFGKNEYTVVELWANDIAVIEDREHRYAAGISKLKKI